MPRNDGSELEDKVYSIIERMVSDGDLPYRKELTRIHRKKKYFSRSREAEIEFENVIEVYSKDNFNESDAKPIHLVFFECKDHGRNVEIGKVEEVIGRLDSGIGINMKAFIVTRKGFSKNALNVARNKGIGLIKIMPDDKVTYCMHYITHDTIIGKLREFPKRTIQALLNIDYTSDGEKFYALDADNVYGSMKETVSKHLLNFERL